MDEKQKTTLIVNAGSSSIKYALYKADDLTLIEKKTIEIKTKEAYEDAFKEILKLIDAHNVTGVGHRVVHGGKKYSAPQKIDAAVLADLEILTPLAPLHQPHNLKAVKMILDQFPAMPQVACFDTAFHRTQSKLNQMYAIPRALTDEGIIRYGFHGASYEYIASVLPQHTTGSRVIVAHLGNGASLCAMKDGKSVATTMGFTPLDGLMMGTRTGDIDPGVSFYLQEQKGLSLKEIANIFNKESGLKGVSGISPDMRTLLASTAPEAKEAVDLFCLYVARHLASLTVDLGGVDSIVFTAGIGENSAVIREKICKNLEHLGVQLDSERNAENNSSIDAVNSKVRVHVIKTNEELMMAQHVRHVMQPSPSVKPAPKNPAV